MGWLILILIVLAWKVSYWFLPCVFLVEWFALLVQRAEEGHERAYRRRRLP